MDIKTVNKVKINPNVPKLSAGDNVRVTFKVKEANRERLQTFPGLVIKMSRNISGGNFTIRKVTAGIGVEHTFPLASPLLEKVEVVRHGKVRRSKLYYIRRLSTKEARLKERRERVMETAATATAEVETVEEAAVSAESSEATDSSK
jgi:large subunit ribosomal protein L19